MKRVGVVGIGLIVLGGLGACSDSGAPSMPVVMSVELTPASATIGVSDSLQFAALEHLSDGSVTEEGIAWSSSGGSVTGAGLFRAPSSPGSYVVIASDASGGHADTATVTVTAAPPALLSVEVTPSSVTLPPSGMQQFTVLGHFDDGTTTGVGATWSASGGTVTATGLFTAPGTTGSFVVIAVEPGGKADTAQVTVAATAPTLVSLSVSPAVDTFSNVRQFSVTGRLSDGSTVANPTVVWTATGGTISQTGEYRASQTVSGNFVVVATATTPGGTVADTAEIYLHFGTGGPAPGSILFITPEPGAAYHCNSNAFNDQPAGLTGSYTVTAIPDVGVLAPATRTFSTLGQLVFGDGTLGVSVYCTKIWQAPAGLVGAVKVVVTQTPDPNSLVAALWTYQSQNNPTGAGQYSRQQYFLPQGTVGPVTDTLFVSATEGGNIWFKSMPR